MEQNKILGGIQATQETMLTEVKKTNGRVTTLENNQNKVKWIAVGMSMVVGGIVSFLKFFVGK